jgi:DNA-binding response OmpR family regulator
MAKILIIDDDNEIVGLLAKLLQRKNYEVLVANRGADGVAIFNSDEIDLVITDIVMPDIGGLEVIRLLKNANSDAKIIAMSGGALINSGTYLTMAKQLGAKFAFQKPFDLNEFMNAINSVLN